MPVSSATFSLMHHSTIGPSRPASSSTISVDGVPGIAAGEAQPGAHGATGDRFVT